VAPGARSAVVIVLLLLVSSAPSLSAPAAAAAVGACAPPGPLDLLVDPTRLDELDPTSRVASITTADPAAENQDYGNVVSRVGSGAVLGEVEGTGVSTFNRFQEAMGGPWTFSTDATSTTEPGSEFGATAGPMATPLGATPAQSQGSTFDVFPMAFSDRFSVTSTGANGNFYGFVRRYPQGTDLSSQSAASNPQRVDAARLRLAAPLAVPPTATTSHTPYTLPQGIETTVARIAGSQQLRQLRFRAPFSQKFRVGSARLRIYFDGSAQPDVDVPLKFAAGVGGGVYQPATGPQVSSLFAVAGGDGSSYYDYDLRWPMPFVHDATVTLTPTAGSGTLGPVDVATAAVAWTPPMGPWGHFRGSYIDAGAGTPGVDLTLGSATGGGRLVGTVVNFGKVSNVLEGNPHLFLDGSDGPQVTGTGTEEWGLGGDYWHNGTRVTLPLGGLPSTTTDPSGVIDGASLYRWLVGDSITWSSSLRLTWEHGSGDTATVPYRAAIFTYGSDWPVQSRSDLVDFDDPGSVSSHRATIPGTTINGAWAYLRGPAESHALASGAIHATLAVGQGATSGFLRRNSDGAVADQAADVYIDGVLVGRWASYGTKARADGTGTLHRYTSDEFPLPPTALEGKTTIEVTLVPRSIVPTGTPAWNATKLELYTGSTICLPGALPLSAA
jgi:hypothetical protein